jgi:hypothetical protein
MPFRSAEIRQMEATSETRRGVTLKQVDPCRRRARVYHLAESNSLFGARGLVVTWGRIGRPPRVRFEAFSSEVELAERWDELLTRRLAHGYLLCSEQAPLQGSSHASPGVVADHVVCLHVGPKASKRRVA